MNESRHSVRVFFLCLLAALLTVVVLTLAASERAQAGPAEPEPQGDPASGWINDVVIDPVGNEDRNPSLATGPGGILHAAWQHNADGSGDWDICYSRSIDGGESWGPCVIVVSGSVETNPDVAVSPLDGRIYIALEIEQIAGNREIFVAYSDNGVAWNIAPVSFAPEDEFNPSIVLEHDMDPYLVHVAFESSQPGSGRDLHFFTSPDRGLSWMELYHYGLGDIRQFSEPKLAYQRCTDMIARLYMIHFVDSFEVQILWSIDAGMTWSGPGVLWSSPELKSWMTVAASRDGDTLIAAWEEQVPGNYALRYIYDQDPTSPPVGWLMGTIDTPNLNDRAPELSADGEGTTSTLIGGRFHLVWTVATVRMNYTSLNTDLSGGLTPFEVPSDSMAIHAQGTQKGMTTQNRGGTWYPVISWMDGRMGDWDIYSTTPGSRVTIDANVSGVYLFVDGQNWTLPKAYNWPAGLNHTLDTPSPQYINATARVVWLDWSDTGPQNHSVQATRIDTTYTAGFMFQYRISFVANPPVGGLEARIDGMLELLPKSYWWFIGSDHEIFAPSPQLETLTDRWAFDYWSDSGPQLHDITVLGDRTYTCYFIREYYVTIDTSPTGLDVEIDAPTYVAPQSFWWRDQSTHNLNAPSPQSGGIGTQYIFQSWSDSQPQSHIIIVNGPDTYTAYFTTQYMVDFDTVPAGLDVIVDAFTYATPWSFWWDEGSSHFINVTSPQAGGPGEQFVFSQWSDLGPQGHSIMISGPDALTATFTRQYYLTITSPYGTTSGEGWYDEMTDAYAGLNTDVYEVTPNAERFIFAQWGGDATGSDYWQSNPIHMDQPRTAQAMWTQQFYLTVNSAYGTTFGEGYYDQMATAYAGLDNNVWETIPGQERFVFVQWGGDATGADFAQSDPITMDSPKLAQAQLQQQFYLTITSPYGTTSGEGWYDEMTDAYAGLNTDVYEVTPNAERFIFAQWGGDATGSDYWQSNPIHMDQPRTAQAMWTQQFYLTVTSAYGTTFGDGWYDLMATAYAEVDTDIWIVIPNEERHIFWQWGGDATGPNYWQSDPIVMNGPKLAQAEWQQQFYLTVSSPYGTTIGDGWYEGGTLANAGLDIDLYVITPNAERWYFSHWGGDASGSDFALSDPINMDQAKWADAVWQQQFYLTVTSPYGTPWGEGWYDAGNAVPAGLDTDTFVVSPNQERYVFLNWGMDATGTDYSISDPIVMNSPKTAEAIWQHQYYLDVQSPYGTTTGQGWYEEMTAPTAGLDTDTFVVTPSAERYLFSQWADDATGSNYLTSDPITMDGPKIATAQWVHQFYLTVDTPYGTPIGEDWYDEGTQAYAGLDTDTYTVTPNVERYVFEEWDADATGTDYMASDPIDMNGPKTAQAAWTHQYWIIVRAVSGGTPLIGITVQVNGTVMGTTPHSDWFNDGLTYGIEVDDPADVSGTDYEFLYWDYGPTTNPASYTVLGSATIIAEYQEIVGAYFEIYIWPTSRQIAAGEVTTYDVNVSSHNGYAGTVSLSLSGLAAPAQGTFNPPSVVLVADGTQISVLTIMNTGSLAQATHTLTVMGNDGTMTDSEGASLIVSGVAATGYISGTVLDQDLNPLAGAVVDLMTGLTVLDTLTSGSNGEFNFTDLSAGTYTVRASFSGYADDNETVTLTPGGWETVTLRLSEIRGSVSGVVKDEETLAVIEGATVEAWDLDGNLLGSDTTSPTGRFNIQDLPLGTFDLRAWAEGYEVETVANLQTTVIVNDVDVGDMLLTPEAEGAAAPGLADYWWVILIVVIVIVLLLVLLAKRRKPEEIEEPAEDEEPDEAVLEEEIEGLDEDWDKMLEETLGEIE